MADFESHDAGVYTDAMSRIDFPQYNSSQASNYGTANRWSSVPDGRAEIVDEDGNKVLRVKYPAGCVGTDPDGCAIQIRWAFHKDEVADTMWASYRVKFEEGFEFVKGGKLPGLCGGACYTGGNTPLQGDGWSARIMWRTGGSIVQYMYFTDQAINYGDDMPWDFAGEQKKFKIGAWHDVATQIILNTVPEPDGAGSGHKNGIVRSWLDGEQVLEVDTIRFVDFAEQKINRFYFSTFHGGSDQTWAPSKDVYVRYDDFRIATTPPENLEDSPVVFSKKPPAKSMDMKFANGVLFLPRPLQEQAVFKLMDFKGRVVWESILAPGQSYLKPPAFSSGIYIWQISGKTFSSSGVFAAAF